MKKTCLIGSNATEPADYAIVTEKKHVLESLLSLHLKKY